MVIPLRKREHNFFPFRPKVVSVLSLDNKMFNVHHGGDEFAGKHSVAPYEKIALNYDDFINSLHLVEKRLGFDLEYIKEKVLRVTYKDLIITILLKKYSQFSVSLNNIDYYTKNNLSSFIDEIPTILSELFYVTPVSYIFKVGRKDNAGRRSTYDMSKELSRFLLDLVIDYINRYQKILGELKEREHKRQEIIQFHKRDHCLNELRAIFAYADGETHWESIMSTDARDNKMTLVQRVKKLK